MLPLVCELSTYVTKVTLKSTVLPFERGRSS